MMERIDYLIFVDKPIHISNIEVLRDYHADDFELLWQLDQICFEPGIAYDKRSLRWFLREQSSFTIVAEGAGGGVCGFILVHGFSNGADSAQPMANIITIDVHPEVRRHGLGSRLLNVVEERAVQQAWHAVTLEVSVENQIAISFYKRHGYKISGHIPKYYNDQTNAYQMEKVIARSQKVVK